METVKLDGKEYPIAVTWKVIKRFPQILDGIEEVDANEHLVAACINNGFQKEGKTDTVTAEQIEDAFDNDMEGMIKVLESVTGQMENFMKAQAKMKTLSN